MSSLHIDLTHLQERTNAIYLDTYDDPHRILILYGGAGSGKSVQVAQKYIYRLLTEKPHRLYALRKIGNTCRTSVYAELTGVIEDWGMSDLFECNKTEMVITLKHNGNYIRCRGLDDQEKIKSLYKPTGFWLEEATEFTPEDISQLNKRLRGEEWRRVSGSYYQIVMSFNPITIHHHIRQNYFNLVTLTPAPQFSYHTPPEPTAMISEPHPRIRVIKSTVYENKFIDQEYIQELEAERDIDPERYQVYTLGNWGHLTGQIFQPSIMIAEDQWPTTFEDECIGIDFGYENPSAMIWLGRHQSRIYQRQMLYQAGMTNGDLIQFMHKNCANPYIDIYADAAEPARIAEIRRAGFNCRPAIKGKGSVRNGIDFCRRQTFVTHDGNRDLNREEAFYRWRQLSNGESSDEPVKTADHLMDARRYACYSHWGRPRSMDDIGRFDRAKLGI